MMLTDKTAVITGASRGIGKAIAVHMAELGAQVIINYNGSEEKAKEVQKEIIEAGGKAFIYQCDVSDFKQCESFVKEITAKFGRIDILVNNAGITKDGLLMSMSEEAFDKVVQVNLKGTFHMIRFVSRQMLKQKSGRIINMASVVGVSGNTCPRGEAYGRKECTNPTRIVTSTVRVAGGNFPVVSVKTASDIPKGKMADCVRALKEVTAQAPIHIGDVLLENVAETGVNIIATRNVG